MQCIEPDLLKVFVKVAAFTQHLNFSIDLGEGFFLCVCELEPC